MSERYTEAELARLSTTEREALTATDVDDEALAEIAGDDDDTDDGTDDGDEEGAGDGDEEETDTDAEQAPAEADQGDAAADAEGEGETEGEEGEAPAASELNLDDIPPVHFVPKLSGDILPEYQQRIDQAEESKQAERDALEDKFEAGEIDSKAYREGIRAIDSALRSETRKIEAASQNAEIGGQLWAAEQAAFFKANAAYTQQSNPVLWGTLNQEVMRVARDPANAGLTGIQVLYTAKANVEKAFSAMFPGASKEKAKSGEKAADKKPVPPKPAAKRPTHQTLRDVPAADTADVGVDRFAHLDKLSGLKLEAAIAAMSDADKQAYLSGA